MPQTTLLVFSHMRWNFIYQRPQHLLTRLASGRRIVFFEEPMVRRAWRSFYGIQHAGAQRPGVHAAYPSDSGLSR